jgi:hypothetical protein
MKIGGGNYWNRLYDIIFFFCFGRLCNVFNS